jgi:PilZ domain-containing protein
MIWLLTIVTFLGTVVSVMLAFLFFFQRGQIRATLRKSLQRRRTEARISTTVMVELSGPDEPFVYEITFTQNVSRYGARVVTKKRWRSNDSVLVKLPREYLPIHARITYCQPLKGDEFAMGLQFSSMVYSWIGY